MKFDLMYYLKMGYSEIMRLDLAELGWYYKKLSDTKEQEAEVEKLKFEANLIAMGVNTQKRAVSGLPGG